MRATIDSAGRIRIPKRLRDEAGIHAGMRLELHCRDGRIEIEPAVDDMHLEWEDGFLVAVNDDPAAVLAEEEVERTRHEIRAERERKWLGGAS